jgi:ketosteroid isomerase-like protein
MIASLYTENATLLPPGAPAVKGRQNIRDFWKAFLDAGAADPVVRPVSVEGAGELAYEVGDYQVTLPNPQGGGTTRQQGKYLVVWKRQSATARATHIRWPQSLGGCCLSPPATDQEANKAAPEQRECRWLGHIGQCGR